MPTYLGLYPSFLVTVLDLQALRPRGAFYKQLALLPPNTGILTSSFRYLITGLAQVPVRPLAVYIRVSSQSQYAFARLRSLLQPLVLRLLYYFRRHRHKLLFVGVATPVLYTYQRNPTRALQLHPAIQKALGAPSTVKAQPKPFRLSNSCLLYKHVSPVYRPSD